MLVGQVSDGLLDWDDQIVDPQWATEKLAQWFTPVEDGGFNGTIHQMHSPLLAPAGKGKDLTYEDGVPVVRAKIVEPTAIKLIDEEVYKGFSIGILDPPIYADPKARNGRIGAPGAGGFVNEVSLVDVPANPRCLFSLAKRRKATAPFKETGIIQIVEDGRVIPISQASHEQIGKAFVASMGTANELTKVLTPKAGRRAVKAAAAAKWYALVKRDMDPDVGGGVDRDALKPSDFVFPDTKDFPVVTPADVTDAVSSWGRYKGSESFESFKSKLTALARRKGPSFVKELPEAWGAKKGKTMTDTATKSKAKADTKPDASDMPDGAMKCKSCKGADCAKCGGKGWSMPEAKGKSVGGDDAAATMAAVAAAAEDARSAGDVAGAVVRVAGAAARSTATKSLVTKDADDDVDDALADAASDLADAMSAQGDDMEDNDKPTDEAVASALDNAAGAVSAAAAAQGADEIADVLSGKGKKGKVKKTAKDDGDGKDDKKPAFPGAAPPFGKPKKKGKGKGKGKKKGPGAVGGGDTMGASTAIPSDTAVMTGGIGKKKGKGKKKGMPSLEKGLHDLLCPAFGTKALKSAYGDLPLPQVLSPEYFGARLAELSAGKGTGDVAEAYAELAAATKLSQIKPSSIVAMREAAAKGFMDAYPDVHLRPQVIDPEDFKRPFISGATPETSSVTRVPMPDMKEMFGPGDFQRDALTTNQARPTLSSGTSVAKSKKGKGSTAGAGNPNSRQFYTNAAKDDNQSAMSLLHDHIVSRYPGVCPMEASQPGTEIDSDGQMGSPAEMQAKGPGVDSLPIPPGAGQSGTLRPVGKQRKADKKKTSKKKVGKAAGTAAIDREAVEGLVDEKLRKERKTAKRREARLGKRLSRTRRKLVKRSDEPLQGPRGSQPARSRPPRCVVQAVRAQDRLGPREGPVGQGHRRAHPHPQVADQGPQLRGRTVGCRGAHGTARTARVRPGDGGGRRVETEKERERSLRGATRRKGPSGQSIQQPVGEPGDHAEWSSEGCGVDPRDPQERDRAGPLR